MVTETQPRAEGASPSARWQFRLWHLFGLMTYVAVMLGVATWLGPQTLIAMVGLGLALLSHLGALQILQAGRTQLVLLGMAWVIYLVSLSVPCYGLAGWRAALIYLLVPLQSIFQADGAKVALYGLPWVICVDLSNGLQAMLPLHIWRLRAGRGQILASVSCLAMVGPWTTLVLEPDLEFGYYLWCASFMVLLVAVRVNRATLIGMVVLAVLLISIFRAYPDSDPGPLKAIPKPTNRPLAAIDEARP